MRKIAYFLFLTATLLSGIASAQNNDGKVAVSVSHSGEDSVGRQFAYAVREAVRSSNGYKLVPNADSGIQINLVTIDPEKTSSSGSYWTAAAVSYTMTNFIPFEKGNPQTWYSIHLNTQVMTVGTQRLNEQARAIMATIDEVLERYRRDSRR